MTNYPPQVSGVLLACAIALHSITAGDFPETINYYFRCRFNRLPPSCGLSLADQVFSSHQSKHYFSGA
jgi:hypothetical protein